MPKPGARGSHGRGDAGYDEEPRWGLDRESSASMPNIGFDFVSPGPAPPGPSPPRSEEKKSPSKARPSSSSKKRTPEAREKREEEGARRGAAIDARGPSATPAPARVAPLPPPSRPRTVPVRPPALRPVPSQAPGPPAAANSGRAPHVRDAAPARAAVRVRESAPRVQTAAIPWRAPTPLPRTPAVTTRPPAPKVPTPAPPARPAAQPSAATAVRPAASTAPSEAASAAKALNRNTKPARPAPPAPQVPASPAPPRASACESPAARSACSSRAGSSMSLVSAGSDDSGPGAWRVRTPSPDSPSPSRGHRRRAPQRRPRSPDETEEEAKRYCLDPPQQRACAPPRGGRVAAGSPSFAEVTRRSPPPSPAPTPTIPGTQQGVSVANAVSPSQLAAPRDADNTAANQPKPKPRKRSRYPPLVVEKLPGWAAHFRALKEKLGHPPSARPYGTGIRFTPESEVEFRVVQRYLTGLEKEDGTSWFAYSLQAERSFKVAIRGLPVDTTPSEIEEELRALGYEPEYVRHIKASQGRPGCVFHAVLKRTPEVRRILDTSVFLCMRGVKIEAWRGKRGPAQCHRCQKWRHSSHHCHRPLACVRCGEGHTARDCPRPRDVPATCVNCGGEHPANNIKCPSFQAEIRANRRAGTVAAITASRRPETVVEGPRDVATTEAPGESLMAAANGPTNRGEAPPSSKRRRGKKKGKRGGKGKVPAPPTAPEGDQPGDLPTTLAQAVTPAAAPTQPEQKKTERPTAGADIAQPSAQQHQKKFHAKSGSTSAGPAADAESKKKGVTARAIQLLMDLIKAIRQGQDAELVVLDGLAALLTLYHG